MGMYVSLSRALGDRKPLCPAAVWFLYPAVRAMRGHMEGRDLRKDLRHVNVLAQGARPMRHGMATDSNIWPVNSGPARRVERQR